MGLRNTDGNVTVLHARSKQEPHIELTEKPGACEEIPAVPYDFKRTGRTLSVYEEIPVGAGL